MEQQIGELIRQTRRQRNLTQTELGGTHYSKSYVSAVERNKIMPSSEALQFFAEQLDQPHDYFTTFSQQAENMKHLAVLYGTSPLSLVSQVIQEEELTFLDIMLESLDHYHFESLREFPTLSPEVVASLPPVKQARYYFLIGLAAQKREEYATALHALESALTLVPAKYQPAILDELGYTYYLTRSYHTALSYHLRALNLLQSETSERSLLPLQFKIEMHCGDDYLALGLYKRACELYEMARSHLNAERDMKTAGLLYLRLGYCTYALIWQMTGGFVPGNECATPEEMENQFQRAMGYLLQSRTVCQVSGDQMGEATANLALVLSELDLSTRRRQLIQAKAGGNGKQFVANYASLLDEAEAKCRQVVLTCQDYLDNPEVSPDRLDTTIYVAFAYLIRIFTQRATLARSGGFGDTSFRECALASFLCQKVLETFYDRSFPSTMIHSLLYMQADTLAYRALSLPRLPDSANDSKKVLRTPVSQLEVYFAAGELAEELGRAATTHEYAYDCFTRANQCFQATLGLAYAVVSMGDQEPGYLVGCYQRCVSILEERSNASPELREETAKIQVSLLKHGLYQVQHLILATP